MPSSPDLAEQYRGSAGTVRFESTPLGVSSDGTRDAVPAPAAPSPRSHLPWSFETAFGSLAPPEPFVVSEQVGVPPVVLDGARRAARSEGYAAGFASGRAEAHRRCQAEDVLRRAAAERSEAANRDAVGRALEALARAGAALDERVSVSLDEVEQLVLDSAFALAESLLGAALRDDDVRGSAAVGRALSLVPAGVAATTVRLHPGDAAVLAGKGELPAGVRLVADPSILPGDAVASGDDTTIETRLSDGLDRAREVLAR